MDYLKNLTDMVFTQYLSYNTITNLILMILLIIVMGQRTVVLLGICSSFFFKNICLSTLAANILDLLERTM